VRQSEHPSGSGRAVGQCGGEWPWSRFCQGLAWRRGERAADYGTAHGWVSSAG
jgi:hypothetical protein